MQSIFGDTERCAQKPPWLTELPTLVMFLFFTIHSFSLTTTVRFWQLGSGQGQKWPLTVKSNRFCHSHFLAFPLNLVLKTNPAALSLRTPSPTLAALCMSPLGARCLLDISCCPTPWVGVKILLWSWKLHSINRSSCADFLVLVQWMAMRLMLTSDKLLGTMGLKVRGLLSGCQERTSALRASDTCSIKGHESPLLMKHKVVRNLAMLIQVPRTQESYSKRNRRERVYAGVCLCFQNQNSITLLLRLCEPPIRGTCFLHTPGPPLLVLTCQLDGNTSSMGLVHSGL